MRKPSFSFSRPVILFKFSFTKPSICGILLWDRFRGSSQNRRIPWVRVMYSHRRGCLRLSDITRSLKTHPRFLKKALQKDGHGYPIFRSLIYRDLRGITTLVGLEFELRNNPSVAAALGFDPFKRTPSDARFSEFLRSTPNTELQTVRKSLVRELIPEGVITGEGAALDSCPIEVPVRENNLKTSVKDRYDKEHYPSGDTEARLGVMVYFPKPYKKQLHYFWGYRNHIVNDVASELPLVEQTLQADKSEKLQAVPLLKRLCEDFQLSVMQVLRDANYDSESIIKFIMEDMKAMAFIPRNPRNTQNTPYTIKKDRLYCQADLPMYRKGKMTSKGII